MTEQATQTEGNLDKVLDKVRKLIAKAEHESTSPTEAQTYREAADALMLKYSIDQATATQTGPANRQKPMIITVVVGPHTDITGYVATMLSRVARHCRCKVRHYTGYTREEGYSSKVYGFESDVRYFEILFTTIRLHMLGVLLPKVVDGQSLEDNCYRLHEAGYNWLEIAALYGWRKMDQFSYAEVKVPYRNIDTQVVSPATMVGSSFKRAYQRAVKARGETYVSIPASSSKIFRESAASGYISRISYRLDQIESGRQAGNEIILSSLVKDINDLYKEDNPDLFVVHEASKEVKKTSRKPARFKEQAFSSAGWSAGSRHANTAELNPAAGGAPRRAL
jgi:hypothetical protein